MTAHPSPPLHDGPAGSAPVSTDAPATFRRRPAPRSPGEATLRFAPPPSPSGLRHAAEQFLIHLRVECGLADHTIESYARDLRNFAVGLPPACAPDDVDPEDVIVWMERLAREGYAPSSRSRMLVSTRSFFAFTQREGWVRLDPCRAADSPRLWRLLPHELSPSEVDALLAAEPGETFPSLRNRAILEVFYATGARVSEVGGLRLRDVDLEAGVLKVQGKGSKERLVLLHPTARDITARYLAEARGRLARPAFAPVDASMGWVFLSRTGRRLDRTNIFRLVKAAARRAGLSKRVYPHLLRHSFATHLLAGGANLRVVQTLLGHARLATTEIYTHVNIRQLRAAHAAFHPRA